MIRMLFFTILAVSCVGGGGGGSSKTKGSGDGSDGNGSTQGVSTPISITSNLGINASNVSSYPVSGICSAESETITVTASSGETATGTCSSGVFSVSIDLSSVSEGTSVTFVAAQTGAVSQQTGAKVVDLTAPAMSATMVAGRSLVYTDHDTNPSTPEIPNTFIVQSTDEKSQLLIQGTCNENLSVINVLVNQNNAIGQSGFVCDGTNFSGTIDLNQSVVIDGTYQFGAILGQLAYSITDLAGNTSNAIPGNIEVDHVIEDVGLRLGSLDLSDEGHAVVATDTLLAVGAPEDDTGASNAGTVHTYRKVNGGWSYIASLTKPSEVTSDDYFGNSLAIEGNRLVVGCKLCYESGENAHIGRAYVFEFDGTSWDSGEELTSTSQTIGEDEEFGASVAIDGGVIVVGSTFGNSNNGVVVVFENNGSNWAETHFIVSGNVSGPFRYGSSVAKSGDRIVVGAPNANFAGGNGTGAAYVYELDGGIWTNEQVLVSNTITGFATNLTANFGTSVDIDGDRIAVGELNAEDTSGSFTNTGAVHVYDHNGTTFTYTSSLEASDKENNATFGSQVRLNGNLLAVGSSGKDNNDANSGKVYVYRFDGASTWNEIAASESVANFSYTGKHALHLLNDRVYYTIQSGTGAVYEHFLED